MIIKNEENYLAGCLESVKDCVDEIVIVDTGSTDNSLEIAKKYGAKIFHFNWINDFSAARNYALKKSTGNWILYLDADERLTADSRIVLKKISATTDKIGFRCNVISPSDAVGNTNIMHYVRLFRNSDKIEFTGKVHEQIETSLNKNGYSILDSKIEIVHLGYDIKKEDLGKKAQRNLDILLADYVQNKSAYNAFQISQTYMVLNKKEEALPFLLDAVADENLDADLRLHCHRFLAAYYNEKNDLEKSEFYLQEGFKIDSEHHLLKLIASEVELKKDNYSLAKKYFTEAYQRNLKLYEGNRTNQYDFILNPRDIILRSLQIAVFMKDIEFFRYFQKEAENYLTSEEEKSYFEFIQILFEKKTILPKNLPNLEKYFKFELLNNLVSAYSNPNETEKVLDAIFEYFKDDYSYLFFCGKFYTSINKLEKGLELFELALKQNKIDPQLILILLSLYVNMGKTEKAISLIDNSLEMFTDFPNVTDRMKSIRNKLID